MGKRSDWKKNDGIADWDMDAKCRHIIGKNWRGLKKLIRKCE